MNRVKKMRIERGLRQLDLAKRANLSLTWIWALENSFEQRVSKKAKLRVAKALKIPYSQLFSNEVENREAPQNRRG